MYSIVRYAILFMFMSSVPYWLQHPICKFTGNLAFHYRLLYLEWYHIHPMDGLALTFIDMMYVTGLLKMWTNNIKPRPYNVANWYACHNNDLSQSQRVMGLLFTTVYYVQTVVTDFRKLKTWSFSVGPPLDMVEGCRNSIDRSSPRNCEPDMT